MTAVIDFGLLGLGGPARDLLPAWALPTAEARALFRAEAGDDATWARGDAAGALRGSVRQPAGTP